MPDAKHEIKPIAIKASIDVETTPADLQPWDAQEKILANTGIERDGGVTNLYTAIESNSLYEETFFTRNGGRVRLIRDDLNGVFRVQTGNRDIGQVPQWGVKSRLRVKIDANDVLATVDGTLLVLKLTTGRAVIQEVDAETFDIIRQRSFSVSTTISDGFLVRHKAPSWSTVVSIVGVYASGANLNHTIVLDSGIAYTATGQAGFLNSSQVFAYYENGWIVGTCDSSDGRVFLFLSDGSQVGTYTDGSCLVANYDRLGDAVEFVGYRDVVTLGTPSVIGNTFTPPPAPLGAWTITPIASSATTPAAITRTFGGFALAYGTAGSYSLLFDNNTPTPRTWLTGHLTPPEIYGYLDNGADVALKVHTILGEAAYISASFAADGIGVPITEVGEMNGAYSPQVQDVGDDIYVVYRRGDGSFGYVVISKDIATRMQEIAPGVVKINTTSALCIADANDNDLQSAGNAFNGFVVVGYNTSGTPVQKAHVARYRGDFGGSVDTGYKSTGAILVGAVVLVEIPEGLQFSANNESIDVYVGTLPASLEYVASIKDYIARVIRSSLAGTLYVDDQIIPPPIGVEYDDQAIKLIGSTAIREPNYDGYALLNEAPGQYDSFKLYGQLYLFDGDWIYAATLSANVLQSINQVTPALGLRLVASSPTEAYFISSFDNSLYTFDGGQSVTKAMRINRRSDILFGAYNVRENTLALCGDDFVLWLRDGLLSESPLPFAYPYSAFSTSGGIWLSKGSYAIRYVYSAIAGGGGAVIVVALDLDGGTWGAAYADTYDGGTWGTPYADTIEGVPFGDGSAGTIDPLIWQSKFNGYNDRIKQSIERFLFRINQPESKPVDIEVEYSAYHETGLITEARTISIPAYDPNGYAYLEYIPQNKYGVAASIKLSCVDKIILLDGFATVTSKADTVAENR